ncbi:MAG: ribonuclease R [Gammaproteobacteria bacterium]|nr:ribonuclease R [Gammaproteobacteria bacterium]
MSKMNLKQDPHLEREKRKYAKPIPSREYILHHLEKHKKAATQQEILNLFKLRDPDLQEGIRRRLIAMCRDGQLSCDKNNLFNIIDQKTLVRGTVVINKNGYGFVIAEDGDKDVFLPPSKIKNLLPEDRVLVRVTKQSRSRREGVVVSILSRTITQITGFYQKNNGEALIKPINKKILQQIIIPKGAGKGAKNGQLVVTEITNYPTKRKLATGKVIEILGQHMDPGMEVTVASRAYNIPFEWPDNVLHEAKQLKSLTDIDLLHRKDLRHEPFVTIDGIDAKDFDDAVLCKTIRNDGWLLYVAIADVGTYVKAESALDLEAQNRGNSVYFPGQVIPMLPEKLSNNLCSLKPNQDRLSMVCEMRIKADGEIAGYKFYEAVINSHARLTYDIVAKMLAGETNQHHKLLKQIISLYKVYLALSTQRKKRGAIDFSTVETKIIFDKNRKIKKIQPTIRNDAHCIIEECMLAANVSAAKFLLDNKIPALFRIHAEPNSEDLINVRTYLHGLGLKLKGGENPKPRDYADLLEEIRGREDSHIIQKIILKSMRQAVYDTENIGHFGLAYDTYGHFTSPIRRYPDLLTHRAIRHLIYGGNAENFFYNNRIIHNIGEHCCTTERRADDAVFDAIDWLKCEYMQDKIGKRYVGTISNVCNFGLFVELKDVYVEGLIHIATLTDDHYKFDQIKYRLIGGRTKKRYSLGDKINIIVAKVNLDNRQIDFELDE